MNGRDCFWPELGIRTQNLSGRVRGHSRVEKAFKAGAPRSNFLAGAGPTPTAGRSGLLSQAGEEILDAEALSEGRGSPALCPRGVAGTRRALPPSGNNDSSRALARVRPPGPQAAPARLRETEGPGRAPSSPPSRPTQPRVTSRRQPHRVGAGGRHRGGCTTARARPAAGCSGPWLERAPCRPRMPREAAAAREERAGCPRRPGPPEPAPRGAAAGGAPQLSERREENPPRR